MSDGLAAGDLRNEKFSMGRVVSQTFGILGRNALPIGVVAVVVNVVSTGLAFGLGVLLGYLASGGAAVASGAGLVGFVIGSVLGCVAIGGITHIALGDLDGRPAGAGAAFATGLRLTGPLVWLGVIFDLGVGLACLLLLVPGLMLAMSWFVAVPVRVVEGPGAGAALARSRELTAGSRWRLFGLAVVGGLVIIVLNGGFEYIALRSLGAGMTGLVLRMVVRVIVAAITTSLTATGFAVCYAELRRIREGATPSQLAAVFA